MLTFNYSLEELPFVVKQILPHLQHKVVLLEGEMGAGKTTFVASIVKALGIKEAVSSPTFSIVNEYEYAGIKVYHFDFYRINHLSEVMEIGAEEYFYSGHWCFVEWSEQVKALLPDEVSVINIKSVSITERIITVENKTLNNS